jgi:hypothetical protein
MATKRLGHSVIECGRGKNSGIERKYRARGKRNWRLVDGEYEPGPMRGDRAELRDNLRPLERWLKSKVGQEWDKVYSEFCAREDKRSLRGDHIHSHLKEMVCGSGGKEGDGRYYRYPYFPICFVWRLHSWTRLFIHNGILREHANDKVCWEFSAKHGYMEQPPANHRQHKTHEEYMAERQVQIEARIESGVINKRDLEVVFERMEKANPSLSILQYKR